MPIAEDGTPHDPGEHQVRRCDYAPSPPQVGSRRSALKLVVEDTGLGMGEDSVVRAFESFAIASVAGDKNRGEGLGLPLSKKICELLGGEIELSSELDAGSTFVIYLPETFPES